MHSATTPPIEPIVSALNSPTAIARAEHAERELRVTKVRNRTLWRAATEPVASRRIALIHGDAVVEPTLRIARLIESQGRVPTIRFARGADNEIIGLEFGVYDDASALAPAPAIEMTVVESAEEIGVLVPRGVLT